MLKDRNVIVLHRFNVFTRNVVYGQRNENLLFRRLMHSWTWLLFMVLLRLLILDKYKIIRTIIFCSNFFVPTTIEGSLKIPLHKKFQRI